jgi:hypothetical protein
MNFKEWLNLTERAFQKPRFPIGKNLPLTPGKHNDFATSAIVPANWTGSGPNWGRFDQISGVGPQLDLVIPQVIRSSFITDVDKNKNPISIGLKDGTKLYLSLDQFNRIQKTPEVGKRITVIFQRSEDDLSKEPSKIEKIEVD